MAQLPFPFTVETQKALKKYKKGRKQRRTYLSKLDESMEV
jgi:hypothetical protein